MRQGKTREEKALKIFEDAGAAMTGHFLLASGEHSEKYIDKKAIFRDPNLTNRLCTMLADKIADRYTGEVTSAKIKAICGPAEGGNVVAYYTMQALKRLPKWNKILYLHTTKRQEGFGFSPDDQKKIKGMEIVIAEDVLTTGSYALRIAEVFTALGGKIVCLGALWNRGLVRPEGVGGIEIISLINKELPSWSATRKNPCKLCKKGIPINAEFGHGQKFLETR